MHLVDIALLGAHRNRGLGTRLIRQLMDECEVGGAALHLHVLRGNPRCAYTSAWDQRVRRGRDVS